MAVYCLVYYIKNHIKHCRNYQLKSIFKNLCYLQLLVYHFFVTVLISISFDIHEKLLQLSIQCNNFRSEAIIVDSNYNCQFEARMVDLRHQLSIVQLSIQDEKCRFELMLRISNFDKICFFVTVIIFIPFDIHKQ